MNLPRVILVIESETTAGKGSMGDPVRAIPRYHTLDGKFLAERDPWPPTLHREAKAMLDFIRRALYEGEIAPTGAFAHEAREILRRIESDEQR